MSTRPHSYSLADLQAHPDILLSLLPDAETRLVVQRDSNGTEIIFTPIAPPSVTARELVRASKDYASEISTKGFSREEIQERFFALREECAEIIGTHDQHDRDTK